MPKIAVYTHLILPGGGGAPPPTPDSLIAATRVHYSGPVVAGADLDRIVCRAGGIFVQHYDPAAERYGSEIPAAQFM
jgi:hypothetical protein